MNFSLKIILLFFTTIIMVATRGNGLVSAQNQHKQSKIDWETAVGTVLLAYPGANIQEVELDTEYGILVYQVELDNNLEVLVDAHSGEIIGTEEED